MNACFDIHMLRGAMGLVDIAPSIRIEKTRHAVKRVQFRFPRSKKKRVRAKWAKRECNVRYEPQILQAGNTYFVHPAIYERLAREIDLTPFEGGEFEWPQAIARPQPTLIDRAETMAGKWLIESIYRCHIPRPTFYTA